MRSDTLAQLLDSLGASRSFSRPRVSNDNPYSEAQFKTLKYQPDYPGRFASTLHGRAWLQDFFAWHNDHHGAERAAAACHRAHQPHLHGGGPGHRATLR